jgi:hypothetical protein
MPSSRAVRRLTTSSTLRGSMQSHHFVPMSLRSASALAYSCNWLPCIAFPKRNN